MTDKKLCPICGRVAMSLQGVCDSCGADLGGVNALLVRAARRRAEADLAMMRMPVPVPKLGGIMVCPDCENTALDAGTQKDGSCWCRLCEDYVTPVEVL